jgi:hypothetical protein
VVGSGSVWERIKEHSGGVRVAVRMNRSFPILAAAIWLIAAGPDPRAVPMNAQPGTELDATARRLVADDLAEAQAAGETPLLLVGSAQLGGPKDHPALFVQLQSARECGSSGCSISVFVFGPKGWRKVLDATGTIVVDHAQHRGMHDLLINRYDRWIWDGSTYADTDPAPEINLQPRKPTY